MRLVPKLLRLEDEVNETGLHPTLVSQLMRLMYIAFRHFRCATSKPLHPVIDLVDRDAERSSDIARPGFTAIQDDLQYGLQFRFLVHGLKQGLDSPLSLGGCFLLKHNLQWV